MVTLLLPLFLIAGLAGHPEAANATRHPADSLKDEILAEVNALRARGCTCGRKLMAPAPPLRWNDKLETAARRHLNDLITNSQFGHSGSDGSSVGDRAAAAGYRWTNIAENIAAGYTTAAAVVAGWQQSKGHCLNMMTPEYADMGVAYRSGFWVQVLGKKR